MKKLSKLYVVTWVVLVALFNLLAFVIPAWGNTEKFTGTFFIGYALTMITFVGQLVVCLLNLNKRQDNNARFLKLPLIPLSIGSIAISAFVGIICAIFSFIPMWITACVSGIILGVVVISYVRVETAATIITNTNEKVRKKTLFIDTLSVRAESLWGEAQGEEMKVLAKKVWEAIRYSDSVSNEGLVDIETQLQESFESFANVVRLNNIEAAKIAAQKVLNKANERNKMCKLFK